MLLKSEDVKKIDKYAIENLQMPEMVLMENAGIGLKNNVDKMDNKICIICGSGNNGGDGLVLARQLLSEGKKVDVFLIREENKLKNSVYENYQILNNLNHKVEFLNEKGDLAVLEDSIINSDLVVDSIFGIGLSRSIEGIYKEIIELMNNKSKKILSVDTPSGFNSNTGEIYNVCIKAYKTVTFIGVKKGFNNKKASKYTGEVVVEQISIPKNIVEKILEGSNEK